MSNEPLMLGHHVRRRVLIALIALAALAGTGVVITRSPAQTPPAGRAAADEFNDSHFHLTNYVQKGIDVRQSLKIMGQRVRRSTLFGIPLQQHWSFANSGDFAPTYYLQSDAPLYYYSFTDAHIASAYRSLPKDDQARFDPMITGFNPADMYGVDHIRRVLETFPGVFTGIGEFSIHKEFVSAKIPGETASLTNPALDRILDFAADVGLVAIIHNDIDMPFAKTDAEPVYLAQMKALLKRHPRTSIIWAHTGLGRIVHPGTGVGRRGATAADAVRDRRDDAQGPGAQPREFRHLVGRSGQVRRGDAAVDRARRRPSSIVTQTVFCSGPTPSRPRVPSPITRSTTSGRRSGVS